jgi:hypothetical protein
MTVLVTMMVGLGVWGVPSSSAAATVQAISGTEDLTAVACTSPTTCLSVGRNQALDAGAAVSINPFTGQTSNGSQSIAGTYLLNAVACPSPSVCLGVGYDSNPLEGVVVPLDPATGTPTGAVQALPGTQQLLAVVCPSSSTCVATGQDANSGIAVALAPDSGAPIGTVTELASTWSISGIACVSVSECLGVGSGPYGNLALPLSAATAGATGSPQIFAGIDNSFSVACPSPSLCLDIASNGTLPVAIPLNPATGEQQGSFEIFPATTYGLYGIACPTANFCEAVGDNGSSTGVTATFDPSAGAAGSTVESYSGTFFLQGLSCESATICLGVGESTSEGVALPQSSGASPVTTLEVDVTGTQSYGMSTPTFATSTTPPTGDSFSGTLVCTTVGIPATAISSYMTPGTYSINGSSCGGLSLNGPSATSYAIAYSGGSFVVHKAATSLTAASDGVIFNSVSATLVRSTDHVGLAGQHVSFRTSGTTICTAKTDANGMASCSVTIGVALGTSYTASYAGNADYLASRDSAKL